MNRGGLLPPIFDASQPELAERGWFALPMPREEAYIRALQSDAMRGARSADEAHGAAAEEGRGMIGMMRRIYRDRAGP